MTGNKSLHLACMRPLNTSNDLFCKQRVPNSSSACVLYAFWNASPRTGIQSEFVQTFHTTRTMNRELRTMIGSVPHGSGHSVAVKGVEPSLQRFFQRSSVQHHPIVKCPHKEVHLQNICSERASAKPHPTPPFVLC